jgi:hypothetical protein
MKRHFSATKAQQAPVPSAWQARMLGATQTASMMPHLTKPHSTQRTNAPTTTVMMLLMTELNRLARAQGTNPWLLLGRPEAGCMVAVVAMAQRPLSAMRAL